MTTHCFMERTASLTLMLGDYRKIPFDAAPSDTLGGADLANGTCVVQQSGLHRVAAGVGIESYNDGQELTGKFRIHRNGSLLGELALDRNMCSRNGGYTQTLTSQGAMMLEAGDVISWWVEPVGADRPIILATYKRPWMLVEKL